MTTYTLPTDGPPLATEDDGRDVLGEAFGAGADLVVIPVARLSPEFFHLGSGLAGAILQKFTNYRVRVAIIGDITTYMADSAALRDFVHESNRRGEIRFLPSDAQL